jgi:hypothetical protein
MTRQRSQEAFAGPSLSTMVTRPREHRMNPALWSIPAAVVARAADAEHLGQELLG